MNPLVNDRVLYLAAGVILILLALIAAVRLRARNGKAQWLSDLDDDPARWDYREHWDRYASYLESREAQRLDDVRKSAAAAYRPRKVTRQRDYTREPH